MPRRIQLQTRHGWRKPQGAVVVNAAQQVGEPLASWSFYDPRLCGSTRTGAGCSDRWETTSGGARGRGGVPARVRGRDLACWCPLVEPCHADVLLEIANSSSSDFTARRPDGSLLGSNGAA